MSKSMADQMAQNTGMKPLGNKLIEVVTDLTNTEKLEVGKFLAECLIAQGHLEDALADYAKGEKEKIRKFQEDIDHSATMIKTGKRTEHMTLPCYLDGKERIYVDAGTGQIMKREPASAEDFQLRMV